MRFLGTKERGRVVIWGVPLEETVSFRPGTRFAPVEVRKVSDGIETYSPYLDMDLEEVEIADVGDIELPFGNRDGALRMIEDRARDLLDTGVKLLSVGGEHLITLPIVKAHLDKYRGLVVVHVDAHTDLRDSYLGERLSHATVMRRVYELGVDVCHLGVRSGLREEFRFAKEHALFFSPFSLKEASKLKDVVGNRPVYLTLDVDVLDPAFCPGVGTPEPGGVGYRDLLDFFREIKGLNLVGADVVELSPGLDPSGNSSVVVASIVRELALILHG